MDDHQEMERPHKNSDAVTAGAIIMAVAGLLPSVGKKDLDVTFSKAAVASPAAIVVPAPKVPDPQKECIIYLTSRSPGCK